jgi:hypothetical protein
VDDALLVSYPFHTGLENNLPGRRIKQFTFIGCTARVCYKNFHGSALRSVICDDDQSAVGSKQSAVKTISLSFGLIFFRMFNHMVQHFPDFFGFDRLEKSALLQEMILWI